MPIKPWSYFQNEEIWVYPRDELSETIFVYPSPEFPALIDKDDDSYGRLYLLVKGEDRCVDAVEAVQLAQTSFLENYYGPIDADLTDLESAVENRLSVTMETVHNRLRLWGQRYKCVECNREIAPGSDGASATGLPGCPNEQESCKVVSLQVSITAAVVLPKLRTPKLILASTGTTLLYGLSSLRGNITRWSPKISNEFLGDLDRSGATLKTKTLNVELRQDSIILGDAWFFETAISQIGDHSLFQAFHPKTSSEVTKDGIDKVIRQIGSMPNERQSTLLTVRIANPTIQPLDVNAGRSFNTGHRNNQVNNSHHVAGFGVRGKRNEGHGRPCGDRIFPSTDSPPSEKPTEDASLYMLLDGVFGTMHDYESAHKAREMLVAGFYRETNIVETIPQRLKRAIKETHDDLRNVQIRLETTALLVAVKPTKQDAGRHTAWVCTIGDSEMFVVKAKEKIYRLTSKPEEINWHKHFLGRSGLDESLEKLEPMEVTFNSGDHLYLCSDGVMNALYAQQRDWRLIVHRQCCEGKDGPSQAKIEQLLNHQVTKHRPNGDDLSILAISFL